MANSICPIIQMTEDCPGLNPDGKLPILDLKVWTNEDGKILHEFYRKEMASRHLMLARSAMPEKMKRVSLTQEALRILRNTSTEVPWERVAEMLTDFCLRMKISGYSEKYRETIIHSALAGWDRMLELDRTGEKPLYRERGWNEENRRKEKESKKSGWFRGKGGNVCDFPIFCPISPGGRLADKWRRIVEDVRASTGGEVRAKVIEQAGVPLHSMLGKAVPRCEDLCSKADCQPCLGKQTKHQSCHRGALGGVGYEQECLLCKEQGKVALYHGESGRTLYTRSKEHQRDLEKKKADNPMFKHLQNFHPGEVAKYNIKSTRFFKDPLTRQINEGVRINNSKSNPGLLMNSKSEFRQGEVARVVLVNGAGAGV